MMPSPLQKISTRFVLERPASAWFDIFLTPDFYVLLRALTGNRPLKQHGAAVQHESFVDAAHPVGGGTGNRR
jgi:hypothetical protein